MQKKIIMSPVKSSSVASIGYDESIKTLAVKFTSGETYHYAGVSVDQHQSLLKAESSGKYLHKHILVKHKHTKI